MSAESENLRQTVEQLHRQLEQADSLDEQAAAELRQAIADIETALESKTAAPQAAAEGEETLAGRLHETAIQFEELHPTIAGTLRRLTDLLSQMGI